jgi:hypothetical protein
MLTFAVVLIAIGLVIMTVQIRELENRINRIEGWDRSRR